mmetsp:Transcript_129717/g.225365  ORF Transcript_129717/g.225365 Transcript_129717/m.225365 type:complete len:602 (+) Transcript_129717:141-1946(+)
MSLITSKYDVLDLKYGDGNPAVLRHIDGTGVAYYPSGRKGICVTAHGRDNSAKARRFAAVVHDDAGRSPVLGAFDDWGRGYADCMMNPGDSQPPKIMINASVVTVIDGNGKATESPTRAKGSSALPEKGSSGSLADVTMRLNQHITLIHKLGRTSLEFSCDGVNYTFVLGELQGDEVAGMPMPQAVTMPANSSRLLDETQSKLKGLLEDLGTIKVDPSQKDTKPEFRIDTTGNLKDLVDQLPTLREKTLTHPNLAPLDLEWSTEVGLKKLLSKHHQQCPGQKNKRNWSIARVSGKCTEERLVNAKPTVETPKTVPMISQLKLPELIDETGSKSTLLVVVCLATYAKEQSNYAGLVAEKAQAELFKRFSQRDGVEGGAPPVRFVAIELAEISGFAEQYGIKEAPYCLMFRGGHLVYSKRLAGMRVAIKDAYLTRPQVLLVESSPAFQFKLERALRRSGYSSDLALDGSHALRLASRRQVYGVLLISAMLRASEIRGVISAVKRNEAGALVVAFNASVETDEDAETRKRVLEECTHTFPYLPSYTGLAAILGRCDVGHPIFGKGSSGKKDLVEEVLGVLDHGRSQKPMSASATLLPGTAAPGD